MSKAAPVSEFRPLAALPLFAHSMRDEYDRAVRIPDSDICERRSGNQGGSALANDRAEIAKPQMRSAVLAAIHQRGSEGLTLRELAAAWRVSMHTISGRFSELSRIGIIVRAISADGTPVLRDGCGVWMHATTRREPCTTDNHNGRTATT